MASSGPWGGHGLVPHRGWDTAAGEQSSQERPGLETIDNVHFLPGASHMVSLRFRGFAVGNAAPLHKPELLQSDSMAVPFCTFLAGSACLAIKMHSFKD